MMNYPTQSTRDLFYRYVVVQFSGRYNMITDAKAVMEVIDCTPDMYFSIIENYDKLKESYKSDYELAVREGTLLQNEEE